jgi:type II secretory pathway predicted ATPase ExeA
MYELFFGLSRRPFAAAPNADCYFPAAAIDSARQTLYRAIDRGEGAGLLIGPAGTGKTLLLAVLAEQFGGRFEAALLNSGRVSKRRELLQAILFELGLPYRDQEEGELRLALIDHLSAHDAKREGLLLLIDEAHTLPLKVLEEIRLITNLVRGGEPKVRLLLAGSSVLEERFTSPKLDAFNQRIIARCYLQAFNRDETREYVRAQIEWAGGQPDRVFSWEALDAVYQASQGIPRLVNQISDHAMLLACAAGTRSLDKTTVEEAWADLQQLPTPRNISQGVTSNEMADQTEVIEFGVLDDDEAAASASDEAIDETAMPQEDIDLRMDIADVIDLEYDVSQDEPAAVPFPGSDAEPSLMDDEPIDPLERLSQVERQLAAIDNEELLDFDSEASFSTQVDLSFEMAPNPFSESFAKEEVVLDPFASPAADALANRPLVACEEGRQLAAMLKPLPERPAPKLSLAQTGDAFTTMAEPVPVDFDDESFEPELIVIEDEPPPMHRVNVVSRHQFGKVFENLRRG